MQNKDLRFPRTTIEVSSRTVTDFLTRVRWVLFYVPCGLFYNANQQTGRAVKCAAHARHPSIHQEPLGNGARVSETNDDDVGPDWLSSAFTGPAGPAHLKPFPGRQGQHRDM